MWSDRRRKLILTILGAIGATTVALTLIATIYQAPSCTDNKQDQGEEGVDCGGPCSTLCTADVSAPSIRSVTAVSPQHGLTDVIAYIDNTNPNAALFGAKYTVSLYGTDGSLIVQKTGTVDLAPASTYPLFISNFYDGTAAIANAFLAFDDSSFNWQKYTDTRPKLSVSDPVFIGAPTPRISAVIGNPTALPLFNVPVVVTVFDPSDNVIAASESVLEEIPPMGNATAVFTWNVPFTGAAAREEVVPLLPLAPNS